MDRTSIREDTQEAPLLDELRRRFSSREKGIFLSSTQGYWSNLDQEENRRLVEALRTQPARAAFLAHKPELEPIAYSPMRQAGLELLDLKGTETCVDYGCMWGALTVPLAKRTRFVLGIDQTLASLCFLAARLQEEKIENVALLCQNLKEMEGFENLVDTALVSGVLEWIPETGPIELKAYFGRRGTKHYSDSPRRQQLDFLRRVFRDLRPGGKLYLAIENRFDFKNLLGARDPHTGVRGVAILPRPVASWITRAVLGRPYVNWIYSFGGLSRLLREAGFGDVALYMVFPNYHYPERIIPLTGSMERFSPMTPVRDSKGRWRLKGFLGRIAERIVFQILHLRRLAPEIIAIATKGK